MNTNLPHNDLFNIPHSSLMDVVARLLSDRHPSRLLRNTEHPQLVINCNDKINHTQCTYLMGQFLRGFFRTEYLTQNILPVVHVYMRPSNNIAPSEAFLHFYVKNNSPGNRL